MSGGRETVGPFGCRSDIDKDNARLWLNCLRDALLFLTYTIPTRRTTCALQRVKIEAGTNELFAEYPIRSSDLDSASCTGHAPGASSAPIEWSQDSHSQTNCRKTSWAFQAKCCPSYLVPSGGLETFPCQDGKKTTYKTISAFPESAAFERTSWHRHQPQDEIQPAYHTSQKIPSPLNHCLLR